MLIKHESVHPYLINFVLTLIFSVKLSNNFLLSADFLSKKSIQNLFSIKIHRFFPKSMLNIIFFMFFFCSKNGYCTNNIKNQMHLKCQLASARVKVL